MKASRLPNANACMQDAGGEGGKTHTFPKRQLFVAAGEPPQEIFLGLWKTVKNEAPPPHVLRVINQC